MALGRHILRRIATSLGALALVILVLSLFAQEAHAQKQNSRGWLMGGVRPAANTSFDGLELTNVREAQDLRKTVAGVIELLSGQSISGHDVVRDALSDAYLVSQFDCGNRIRCLAKLYKPLAKRGFARIVLGTYFVAGDRITIRLDILALQSGKIVDTITTSLARNKVKEPTSWVGPLQPLFSSVGSVQLQVNVEDFELTVDGKPRDLDDKDTITLSPGLHILEVSKADYQSTSLPVTIKKGELKPVALALAPIPKLSDYLASGQLNVQSLLKAKRKDKKVLSLNAATALMYTIDRTNKKTGGEVGALYTNFVLASDSGPISLVYIYDFFSSGIRGVWFGLELSEEVSTRVGVIPVNLAMPFFATYGRSLSWSMGYDDENDAGFDVSYSGDRLKLRAAYFLNDEYALFGGSGRVDRAAPDLVTTGTQLYQERHLGVGSVQYRVGGKKRNLSVGATGAYGGIYNASNKKFGRRWSAAGYFDALWGPVTLKAQAIRYRFAPKQDVGADTSVVSMGYFGTVNEVASHGTWVESSFRYTTGLEKGPLTGFNIHGGYSHLYKRNQSFANSMLGALGVAIQLGDQSVFINGFVTKNSPGTSDPEFRGLGRGYADARWFPAAEVIVAHSFAL